MEKITRDFLKKSFVDYKRNTADKPIKEMIEKVIEHYKFDLNKTKLIKLYLFEGRTEVYTCLQVCICRTCFYKYLNEILELAKKWAEELWILKER